MARVFNFNPGPAVLPLPVLEQAQQELTDYHGTGISILEMSHRAKEFEAVNAQAEERLKSLLGLDESYRVLFIQGGASMQFAMVPLNFLTEGRTADYILSGAFAEKARDEAERVGTVHVAASTKAEKYCRVPRADEIQLSESPAYVHITSNNTIYGTQWRELPDLSGQRVVGDMSSDILSRPFDAAQFSLIYAGAQKNLGPSGVTVVIVRTDWLSEASSTLPAILSYDTYVKSNSLYNTPPTFGVYLLNLVLGWVQEQGGVEVLYERNQQKAKLVYDAIDASGGYYRGHAAADSRSLMNITFRLPSEAEEKQFVQEAAAGGLVGLAGHRSVGGIRASLYNAMPVEGCEALAAFMQQFASSHG